MSSKPSREEIARIIDPVNFNLTPSTYGTDEEGFKRTFAYGAQLVALQRADAVIAALTPAPEEPRKYLIGDRTMSAVFEPAGLKNVSDLQAVFDAVEKALAPEAEPANACAHDWRSEWGHAGPIQVCSKCGDWHHD